MPSFSAIGVMAPVTRGVLLVVLDEHLDGVLTYLEGVSDYLGIAPSSEQRVVTCLVPMQSCINTEKVRAA